MSIPQVHPWMINSKWSYYIVVCWCLTDLLEHSSGSLAFCQNTCISLLRK